MLEDVLKTIDGRRDQAIALLKEFVAIPSVSTQPEHATEVRRCAQWVADQLRFAALDVAVLETGGHPCVVAKNKHVPGRPTVLVYGHYDVQPPDPMDGWLTPPFTPTVGKTHAGTDALFGRGAVDDKGQVLCHIEAITAWQAHGGVPVNLTVLIEGEEEIGSANLGGFITRHRDALAADVCVISDTNQFARGYPAITTGLRGLVYQELIVKGPNRDLHSGIYGGAVTNPANALAKLISTLHTNDGRVNLPGFYDDVIEPSDVERLAWQNLPFDEAAYKLEIDIEAAGGGEQKYGILERTWARPTCDVNGLTNGYQGPGAKTVIGAWASAKISFRLVANQDPIKIRDAFQQAMRDRAPAGVTLEFHDHGLAPAYLVPQDHWGVAAARRAIQTGFGLPATLIGSGGSIPIAATIKQQLGIDSIFVGFGLPDDAVHSPNEKFDLDCLAAGSRTAAALYAELARQF
ncbi:MAG TPA: dipeptidase [Tepidisphaeraceae bacterium]|jgi:acetylornithine deacetylase/succinyl-diaminopimelate desuccinylase-like protein